MNVAEVGKIAPVYVLTSEQSIKTKTSVNLWFISIQYIWQPQDYLQLGWIKVRGLRLDRWETSSCLKTSIPNACNWKLNHIFCCLKFNLYGKLQQFYSSWEMWRLNCVPLLVHLYIVIISQVLQLLIEVHDTGNVAVLLLWHGPLPLFHLSRFHAGPQPFSLHLLQLALQGRFVFQVFSVTPGRHADVATWWSQRTII